MDYLGKGLLTKLLKFYKRRVKGTMFLISKKTHGVERSILGGL